MEFALTDTPPILSFALRDDGTLLINLKGTPTEANAQNKEMSAAVLKALKDAGIVAKGTRDGEEFGWTRSSDFSAIFANEKPGMSVPQAEFKLEGDANDPKTLAKIAAALNAPGVRYTLDVEKDYLEVKATINPEELREANGDVGRLTVAANNKVSQAELTTAPAMMDVSGDMHWQASKELPKALGLALAQAKDATAGIAAQLTGNSFAGAQQVTDVRTPDRGASLS